MYSFVIFFFIVVVSSGGVNGHMQMSEMTQGGCEGVECEEGQYCQTFGEGFGYLFHSCIEYVKEGQFCNSRRLKCSPGYTCAPFRENSMFGFGQCKKTEEKEE